MRKKGGKAQDWQSKEVQKAATRRTGGSGIVGIADVLARRRQRRHETRTAAARGRTGGVSDSGDGGRVPWGRALGTWGAADRATPRFLMVSGHVVVLVVSADT